MILVIYMFFFTQSCCVIHITLQVQTQGFSHPPAELPQAPERHAKQLLCQSAMQTSATSFVHTALAPARFFGEKSASDE